MCRYEFNCARIDGDVKHEEGSQLSTSSIMMENSIACFLQLDSAVGLTLTGTDRVVIFEQIGILQLTTKLSIKRFVLATTGRSLLSINDV